MGAQFCSPGGDVVLQLVGSSDIEGLALNLKGAGVNADLPIAKVDADGRNFQPMSAFCKRFEAQEAALQDPFSQIVREKSSGSVRRCQRCRKPAGKDCQHRLRTHLARLQAQSCDGIARILEVFEDSRSLALVIEHPNGGTLHDRILQRHFFAEQESAVLVKHMLETVRYLHGAGLYHGNLSPDCFRFHSDRAHAPLKLVDFGLDLKMCLCEWSPDQDQLFAPSKAAARNWPRASSPQFFEACRLVFWAPEVFKRIKSTERPAEDLRSPDLAPSWLKSATGGQALEQRSKKEELDLQLLSQDEHLESEDLGMDFLAKADVWSVGAMAFLLLCGYPPFFAPCRSAIISRVKKIDFSFDPPFWSKISEEAKEFVQKCLRGTPTQRLNADQALQHTWIQKLADTSPSGPMLPSFALNLRRFYRTSIIEALVAKSLATKLSYRATLELQLECQSADKMQCGFLTSAELRQVLQASGHADIVEAIGSCFARYLKHAGESYLDYHALFDSVRLRREHALEEEIWQAVTSDAPGISFAEGFDLGKVLRREGMQEERVQSCLCGVKTQDFAAFMKDLMEELRSAVSSSMANASSKE